MFRSRLVSLWRNVFRRDRVDEDLDAEVHSCVEMLTDERISGGLEEDAARRAARLDFGDVNSVREQVHEQRTGAVMEQWWQDARYGLRMAGRNPGFAGVVILTLAVGIATTTAVFSVVYAVLLNPLPFPHADRIVTLWQYNKATPTEHDVVAPGNFLDWRDRSTAFDEIATYEAAGLEYLSDGEPQNLRIWRVSEGFFDVFGVPALHGRTFAREEHQAGTGMWWCSATASGNVSSAATAASLAHRSRSAADRMSSWESCRRSSTFHRDATCGRHGRLPRRTAWFVAAPF